MFNSAILSLQIYATMLIAQATPQIDTTEEATLAFSGPQFFIALIAGLVLAFGFQMLLTNFSVAAGISVLDFSAKDRRSSSDSDDGLGGTIRTVETAAGVWTLATVTISLFVACLLAIKLSFLSSALMGATVGLVIWAAYFSVLVWMSSTAVGSLVGSVVGAATSGFQAIFGTATAALGAKAASSQVVSTAEATAAAIRKELTAYIDPADIKESLNSYIGALKSPELNVQSIGQEFERLLKGSDLRDALKSGTLPQIDRSTFETLVSDRTDLSRKDAKRIVDELEKSWHNITKTLQNNNPLQDLVDFFQSGQPQQLLSSNADDKLNQLLDKLIQQNQNQDQSPGWVDQAIAVLTSVVVGRTDLSELDVETMMGKFNDIKAHLQKQTNTITAQLSGNTEQPTGSALEADVEDYLRHTYPWKLTPAQIKVDFRAILTNPQASAREVRQEVEMLRQSNFAQILQSRGLFTQSKIAEVTDALERVRQQVWQECYQAESAQMAQRLNRHLHSYLLSTDKAVLTSSGFSQGFKAVLEEPDADPQMLHEQLSQLDSERIAVMLRERSDLDEGEIYNIRQEAERLLREAIADTEGVQAGIQTRVDNQWQRLQDYLRNTGKEELNPEGIKRDLQTLLDDPEAGIHDLQWRLRRFDRDTLVQLLSQQRNLSEGDANRILDDVESSWNRAVSAPKTIAHSVQSQYDKTKNAVADYLRNTGKDELNPEGIRNDLSLLLNDPKHGVQAFQDRFSHMDRDTLIQLLTQRGDLSYEEVNRIIDTVQQTFSSVVKTPQRLVKRVTSQVGDFQSTFADYLRNTDKAELNPESIQRDLTVLFNDPKLGMERLSDRLSKVDRSTVVALLSQRQDISEAEANEIVDRVLAVREQFMAQVEAIKVKIQSAINSVFERIREYLNGLDRPELNYEGIQTDVRKLFEDPEAGFEALRDRLGQFDRNTLIAVLSSREDISEADANRIVDQIDHVRTSVLQRAERIQTQIQTRLESLKRQAQAQADATRKAAARAAWWLFATALTSGIASAVGGILAVQP